ncbi:hypothetical protein BDR03DRAFT_951327 [Suillus americanus]|nr:hypothetical protein BDR03DRAFT_951327 [Suillus americanus]
MAQTLLPLLCFDRDLSCPWATGFAAFLEAGFSYSDVYSTFLFILFQKNELASVCCMSSVWEIHPRCLVASSSLYGMGSD